LMYVAAMREASVLARIPKLSYRQLLIKGLMEIPASNKDKRNTVLQAFRAKLSLL